MHGFVSYRCFGKVRSLRSDRAWLERVPMAILELVRGRFGYVADLDMCPLPPDNRYLVVRLRLEQDSTARLFVKILFYEEYLS